MRNGKNVSALGDSYGISKRAIRTRLRHRGVGLRGFEREEYGDNS
jgi:hypothetical protein